MYGVQPSADGHDAILTEHRITAARVGVFNCKDRTRGQLSNRACELVRRVDAHKMFAGLKSRTAQEYGPVKARTRKARRAVLGRQIGGMNEFHARGANAGE